MPKLDLYSAVTAKKLEPISISAKIFNAKINESLMAQAVRVYLSNQRIASARTKDRGDVQVTHAKVWRQKGTGRARHGSRNAPIFVGGAKAHGPTGTQNYSLKLTQKMKQLSLASALTQQFKAKRILALSGLEKLQPKTKLFNQLINRLKLPPRQILLVIDKPNPNISRASGNLPYLTLALSTNLNTYQVLKAKTIILTKEALTLLK